MAIQLTEEQQMIRKMVREFAEAEIAPVAEKLWEGQAFPYDIWKKGGELGLAGFPYPEEVGGAGGDWLSFTIILEELARVDCAVANAFMANSSAASLINNYGSKKLKESYLPPILTGEQVGAIGLSEPNAGSDAANIQTTARLEGDEWVINGSKIFISNSDNDITGPVVVAAVTGKKPDGRNQISNFVIPNGVAGFTYGRKLNKIGWRASSTGELFFDQVRIPKDHLLGEEGKGLKQTLSTISTGRILIGAMALGIIQGSIDRSLQYMQERKTFGKPLTDYQSLQFALADMATNAHAARLMLYQVAMLKDEGKPFEQESSMAKLFSTEKAMEAAHQAIQLHGGYGIMSEYPVSRAFGDAKVLEIVEGTSEIQRLIISRRVIAGK
ncbi:acyl-CoA dehydrogenase family protein [Alkalihalobacillus oceani]|uniref:acyl-CoA dehydrogenase family protein n=1 Tax=Halalkalibacter oceani TaxID=1653776 RepID=UPI00203B4F3B|nr:acyl-CoA dehydrogenase family protein [Halalkalibacter oceani]MCM3759173.1 acyl-CoA dehydrogenase family protein [Halalkalibacter oceani]